MNIYLAAFIISSFILFFTYWISKNLKLLDYPNRNRKLHLQPTPYTGGVAILIINILLIVFIDIFIMEIKINFIINIVRKNIFILNIM